MSDQSLLSLYYPGHRSRLPRPWGRRGTARRRRPDLPVQTSSASAVTRSELPLVSSLHPPRRPSGPLLPRPRSPPCASTRTSAVPLLEAELRQGRYLSGPTAAAGMDVDLPRPPADGCSHPFGLAVAASPAPHRATRVHVDELAAEVLARRRSDPAIQGRMTRTLTSGMRPLATCRQHRPWLPASVPLLVPQHSRPLLLTWLRCRSRSRVAAPWLPCLCSPSPRCRWSS